MNPCDRHKEANIDKNNLLLPTELSSIWQYKYLVLLIMLYVTVLLVSLLTVYKIVKFGSSIESGSVFIIPFTFVIADIITEVYGYQVARQIIWFSVFCEIAFIAMLNLINLFPSPSYAQTTAAYNQLLPPLIHVFLANTISRLISEFLNIYIISKWKIFVHGRYFWIRSIGASAVGGALCTSIAGFLTFFNVLPFPKLLLLLLSSYLCKELVSMMLVYPAVIISAFLKRVENIDAYDLSINFNPFKLRIIANQN